MKDQVVEMTLLETHQGVPGLHDLLTKSHAHLEPSNVHSKHVAYISRLQICVIQQDETFVLQSISIHFNRSEVGPT